VPSSSESCGYEKNLLGWSEYKGTVIEDSDHLYHPGQPESSKTLLRKPEISQFTMILQNVGKYLPQQMDTNMLDQEHEGTTKL
jgi:hypothetical protein